MLTLYDVPLVSHQKEYVEITKRCQDCLVVRGLCWACYHQETLTSTTQSSQKPLPSQHHFPNQTEWVLVSRTTNHRPPSPGAVLVFSPPMKSLQIRLVVEWQLCAMLWVGVFQHGLLSLYSIRFLSKTNCILEICFMTAFVEHQNSRSQPIKLSLREPGDIRY